MSNQVAQIILQQLGGRRFLVMTGAKNLLNGGDYVQFDVQAGLVKGKANKVRVTLDQDDTYTVTTMKYSRKTLTCSTVSELSGVYCDMLQEVFTSVTGLDTRL